MMSEQPKSVLHNQTRLDSPNISGFALRSATPKLPGDFASHLAVADLEKDHPDFAALKTHAEKRAWLLDQSPRWKREADVQEKKLARARFRLVHLTKTSDACRDIVEWMGNGLLLERPDGLSFPSLRKAMAAGEYVTFPGDHENAEFALSFEKEVFRYAELFSIEHDWAKAFEASNLGDAPFKLPYDVCAFEFKISGRSIVTLATQLETDVLFAPCIKADDLWAVSTISYSASRAADKTDICGVIGPQIRAICIALEAGVARADVTRQAFAGVTGKNSTPIQRPYHVVSLAHRTFARPLSTGGHTDRKVRLHFRRGHWRHFESHKTWINWMLVGDPDLGFVEKHYRL